MDHNKLWKALREMGYETILPVSLKTYMRVKKQQLEPCMEQLTGSGLRKQYGRAVYLTCTQSTSHTTPGWMSYKLESRLLGETSTTSDMWMISP